MESLPLGTIHVNPNAQNHCYHLKGDYFGCGGGRFGRGVDRFGKTQCQICHKSGHDASICYHRYSNSNAPSFSSRGASFNPFMMTARLMYQLHLVMLLQGQLLLDLLYLKLFSLVQILISSINGGIWIQVCLTMLHLILQICLTLFHCLDLSKCLWEMFKVCLSTLQALFNFHYQIILTYLSPCTIYFLCLTSPKPLSIFVNLLRTIMFSLNFTLNFVLSNHRLRLKSFFLDLLELMVYTNFPTHFHNYPSLFLVLIHVYLHLLKLLILATLVIMN